MVNSTDSISVYRQIFNAVVRPNLWLPYFQARGTLSGSIKGIIFLYSINAIYHDFGERKRQFIKT